MDVACGPAATMAARMRERIVENEVCQCENLFDALDALRGRFSYSYTDQSVPASCKFDDATKADAAEEVARCGRNGIPSDQESRKLVRYERLAGSQVVKEIFV